MTVPFTSRPLYFGDARRILTNARPGYDLIVNDAFHGVREITFHLVTREFNRLVAARLSPGGIYAVNVMGHPRESHLVQRMTRTLAQDFRHVHHFTFITREIQNIWILAAAQPIPLGPPAPAPAAPNPPRQTIGDAASLITLNIWI